MLTMHVLCCSLHEDADELFLRELSLVLSKDPNVFAKRNQEKIDAGLTGYLQARKEIREHDAS